MENRRIESREEVAAFLARLKYALEHGAEVVFQKNRRVDLKRNERFSNGYAMKVLFPKESPEIVLRRELKQLTESEYLGTVADLRYPNNEEMREFGKCYRRNDAEEEVYIKVRVEIMKQTGIGHVAFVMSFHFAEKPFSEMEFPYGKSWEDRKWKY